MEKSRKKISRDLKLENPQNWADATHGTETFYFSSREGVAVYQQCYEVAVCLSVCLSVSVLNTPPWNRTASSIDIRSPPPCFSNRLTAVITGEVTSRSYNRDAKYFTLVPRTKSSTQEPAANFSILYVRWYPDPTGSSGTLMYANASRQSS